jgi:hypothetical protein
MRRLVVAGALLVVLLTAAPDAGASPRTAKPVAGPATYVPKVGAACRPGYHRVTAHRSERVHGKIKKVAYAECGKTVTSSKKSTGSTAKTATIKTITQIDPNVTFPNAMAVLGVVADSGNAPPGNDYSVSLVDKATGGTIGVWTANPSTNAIAPTNVTIDWTFAEDSAGDYVLTLSATAIQGVTWNGPATVTLPAADVAGIDIAIQATFEAESGYASSTSPLTTLAI